MQLNLYLSRKNCKFVKSPCKLTIYQYNNDKLKGVRTMKNSIKGRVLKLVTKVAVNEASRSANTSCMCFAYQPKVPKAVKKLRKF